MDEKVKSLLNNTLIYTIGNFGSKILTFALLPLYSYYLNKSEFGNYDLIITTITLAIPIVGFQFSDAIFRWLINHKKENNNKYGIISNGLIVLLISIILSIIFFLIVNMFYNIKYKILIYLLLLVSIIYPVFQQIVRGLGLSKIFAFSGVVYSLILVLSTFIFLIIFNLKLEGLLVSSIVANLTAIIWLVLKSKFTKYWDKTQVSFTEIKTMINYSLPLIPNTISWWLVNSANKYIILYYLGAESNGVFGLANRFPALLVMINSIFILAWQESAIVNHDKEDRVKYFSKIINGLIWIQILASCFFSISSQWLVNTIVAKEFYESWEIMPFLFFGVAFSTFAGFYGTLYLSLKKTKYALYTSLTSGIVNVLLCLLFIQKLGIQSASLSTFIGYILLFLIRAFHTKKILAIEYDFKGILLLFVLSVTSIIVSFLEIDYIKIILIAIIFIIALVKYKVLILKTINLTKAKITKIINKT